MPPPGGSPLPRRPQLLPVPAADVLYAARHSLLREVRHAAAAVATPRGSQGTAAEAAEAARRLGALRLWVSALARGVPRAVDGGLLARGLAELEVEMDAWEEADLPGEQQWAGMLQRAGISESIGSPYLSEAATRLVMCTSAMPARHGYPCSLWLLFHTLLAHSSPEHAPQTLEAILRYVDVFFSCAECVVHFRSLALHLSPPPAAAPAAGAASAGGGGGGGEEEEEEARGAAAPLAGGSAAFRRLSAVVRRIRLVASRRVQAASLGGASADQAKRGVAVAACVRRSTSLLLAVLLAKRGLLLAVLLAKRGAACGGCDRRRRDLDKGLPMWMGQASKRGWLGRRRGKAL
ncbi:hypothetical protein EMIHUDRAFT_450869 [Emiliania huxleyi CCMP1516]|uniref:Sulfhydryl oxidase n=2 Tax=Emiliania huxleyi TaxID=2903 RepID=A0A0D3JBR7_EMIH1|nr:hypothetical protein EMIHUDRAFT_450869 [Emiliania huxleyi CCMP1516]EOD20952.1 hypothetical protein EMIHUDRAFT_450869 [Emiliania huxleyi CCMP1516]|eukprot:XP_005773381.1 hypothetical protein EMIHUDRAFT_450869 [Emiliania huxleyi CCMP1516]